MSALPRIDAPFTLGAQLEARASDPDLGGRVAVRSPRSCWTYSQFRDEAVRIAHFLRRRLGRCDDTRPGHVAILLENHPELLALLAACGYNGMTLFGINTGLRGDTLAGVLNQSRARLLVVDEAFHGEVERVREQLKHLPAENLLVLRTRSESPFGEQDFAECVSREVGGGASPEAPEARVTPESNLMVIYTSGTTGLPKGINNNHAKLLLIGANVSRRMELGPEDAGYACMPLFHSNALFLGFQPIFHVGGALALRERFSASGFVPDILEHGVTFWNYVGEPVHYILQALEKQYGGDEERILAEVAGDPRNRLRYALGNGAAPVDIDRFTRWLGLEDMYELYGSTEAAITTFRTRNDPRGSVGEITDAAVRILDERGAECPPAEIGPDGKITNYAAAVGEICRVAADASLFQGYFDNPDATATKYREGVYHSGDLGHVQVVDGHRYLFFDGRTDDWIRKDGENFSAAQVARLLMEHPDVTLAAAYGAPCAVSDELVMAALKLRPGAEFDPRGFFEYCQHQTREGSMDPKWFPDFVRIVDEFEYTQTQKILVRNLKKLHFDRHRLPEARLYWRRRGHDRYRPFGADEYEALRAEFEAAERVDLLDR